MELIFKLKNNEPIMLRADSLNYELCKIRQRKDEVTGVTEKSGPLSNGMHHSPRR